MASLMPLQKGIVPWKVWSQGGAGGSQSGPGVCLGSAPGRLLSGPGVPL